MKRAAATEMNSQESITDRTFASFPPRGSCNKKQLLRLARQDDSIPLFQTPIDAGVFELTFVFDGNQPVPLEFVWESPRAVKVLVPSYTMWADKHHGDHTTQCNIVMRETKLNQELPLQWVYWYDHDDSANKVAKM